MKKGVYLLLALVLFAVFLAPKITEAIGIRDYFGGTVSAARANGITSAIAAGYTSCDDHVGDSLTVMDYRTRKLFDLYIGGIQNSLNKKMPKGGGWIAGPMGSAGTPKMIKCVNIITQDVKDVPLRTVPWYVAAN